MDVRLWKKRAAAGLLSAVLVANVLSGTALAARPGEEGLYRLDTDSLSVLTDELGNTTVCGYDSAAELLRWVQGPKDTAATRTNYEYDAEQRLTAVEKAVSGLAGGLAAVTGRYTYEDGRLTEMAHSNTAAASTEYRFLYDAEGRLAGVQVGGRTLAAYRYGGAGQEQPTETLYANGDALACEYDGEGRLTAACWNGDAQTAVRYTYDSEGRVAAVTQAGQDTCYTYDAAGRRTALEQGGARRVQWAYDEENNLAGITETQDGGARTVTFRYDEQGRLAGMDYGAVEIAYTYGEGGRLERQTLLHEGAPVVTRTADYLDAADGQTTARVAAWRTEAGGQERAARYTYDANGNIESITDEAGTVRYTYDEADQLVREDNAAAGRTWAWVYDAGGNLLEKRVYPYTEGALGEPERVIEYTYGESRWGDLLQGYDGRTLTTDENGSLLEDGVWSYHWAAGRTLAGMRSETQELAFRYDADGLRVEKSTGSAVWRYTYVEGRLTSMTDGTDCLRFGYDAEGPAFVEYNGTPYFYLRNLQGDVTGLVDAAGELAAAYRYDAWGVPLAVTGPLADTLGQANPLRYRGYLYDAETGLYYLESRYYDPALGRFLSADEVVAGPGTALLGGNLFAYGLNNPVNTSDPDGAWPRWITAGFAALSAAVAVKQHSLKAALTALAATAAYRLQVVHFDVREALNINIPLTREEAIAAGWLGPDTEPVGPSSMLHQFTSTVFGENVKYVSPDGYREAIYDAWGRLIADVRDIGTYNFAPSGTLWGDIRHFFLDMLPWMVFGNADRDPGPLLDGLIRLFK